MIDKFTVELVEDPETGEIVLPFPPELLAQMGWDFGDTLSWDLGGDSVVISKKD